MMTVSEICREIGMYEPGKISFHLMKSDYGRGWYCSIEGKTSVAKVEIKYTSDTAKSEGVDDHNSADVVAYGAWLLWEKVNDNGVGLKPLMITVSPTVIDAE